METAPSTLSTAPPASGQPSIEFSDVRLGFDEGEILRGVTFSAKERETAVIVGETGAGKTLLLKLAAGLLRPNSGKIWVQGQEISSMRESELLDARRKIGFVFQEGALFDSLTVGENVAYRLYEDGVAEEEIAARVAEVLQFVELAHTSEMLPSELSGGMRRRVAIARALIAHPPIVLYDSPTAGLDPITSQAIISLILRLRDVYGVTALMATARLQDGFGLANFHFDPRTKKVLRGAPDHSTQPVATHFVVLRNGRIYFEGAPDEFMHSKDPYLRRFLI
ncbi:MAG TPA: ATP-binding cassette domain-containing protein [Terriglobales bacterium]|nr:ATP-binding cassette domain-containing protein [Terriglobales bacterium]